MSHSTIDQPAPLSDLQSTEPATHTVLVKLREMVVSGAIKPGSRLRAEALATLLNVSRTPIRSALAVLSAEGLVTYSMNKGYTVRAVALRDVLDAIEVRASIEGLACRASVNYGWADEGLAAQADVVRRAGSLLQAEGWSEARETEWYSLNWTFHRAIMLAAHNAVLRNAVRMTLIYPSFGDVIRVAPSVTPYVPPKIRQLSPTRPEHLVRSQADHEAILAALTAGEAEKAQEIMTEHVLRSRSRILEAAILR